MMYPRTRSLTLAMVVSAAIATLAGPAPAQTMITNVRVFDGEQVRAVGDVTSVGGTSRAPGRLRDLPR